MDHIARQLGERIKIARINRRLRQQDLVDRSSLSRSTIQAIEKGDPATSLGNYLHVLWLMGLHKEFDLIADPGLDREGLALSLCVATKRVKVERKVVNDF